MYPVLCSRIMPKCTCILMLICVFANYFMICSQLHKTSLLRIVVTKMAGFIFSSLATLFIIIIYDIVGEGVQAHAKTLWLWKTTSISGYEKKLVKAVHPYKLTIGPFHKTGRMTTMSLVMSNIKYTGKSLIWFKN
jgi:hypothetical protein